MPRENKTINEMLKKRESQHLKL